MGPFELTDLIGHDVNYAVTCSVFDAFYGDFRFQPSLVQKSWSMPAAWGARAARVSTTTAKAPSARRQLSFRARRASIVV